MKNQEIERKWLMEAFPALPMLQESFMEQGYLAFAPNTVRIRKTVSGAIECYWVTIKGKGTLQRVEVETQIDKGQYDALKGLLLAPIATKKLRTYSLDGGAILECSLVDEGQETAFYYAEVEFSTIEEAEAFEAPVFLGREVTYEAGYSMAEYCKSKLKK